MNQGVRILHAHLKAEGRGGQRVISISVQVKGRRTELGIVLGHNLEMDKGTLL